MPLPLAPLIAGGVVVVVSTFKAIRARRLMKRIKLTKTPPHPQPNPDDTNEKVMLPRIPTQVYHTGDSQTWTYQYTYEDLQAAKSVPADDKEHGEIVRKIVAYRKRYPEWFAIPGEANVDNNDTANGNETDNRIKLPRLRNSQQYTTGDAQTWTYEYTWEDFEVSQRANPTAPMSSPEWELVHSIRDYFVGYPEKLLEGGFCKRMGWNLDQIKEGLSRGCP